MIAQKTCDRRKNAFTLVELIVVILIFGILAVAAIPKFVNLTKNAKRGSDDYVMGALKTAIDVKQVYNAANNIKNSGGEYWPEEAPFSLLDPAPPVGKDSEWGNWTADVWRQFKPPGESYWTIYCPHYKNSSAQGRIWLYYYKGPNAGKILINADYGI